MLAGANQEGICLLEFSDRRMLETQLKRLKQHLKAETLPGKNALFIELEKQLNAYFAGKLQQFDLPLVYPGTTFQVTVWEQLRNIPYAETRSYKDLSVMMQRPTAMRAIGRANGDNRLAILIPCHRVIGENGKLTGYGGGFVAKTILAGFRTSQQKNIDQNHQICTIFGINYPLKNRIIRYLNIQMEGRVMNPIIAFILGLLVGWLVEWVIDWFILAEKASAKPGVFKNLSG